MLLILFWAIGLCLGYFWRDIQEIYAKLAEKKEPEQTGGVTLGAYATPKDVPTKKAHSAVVSPKTAQQLEFEKNQRELKIDSGQNDVRDIINRANHPHG
jgi:hypothetical protein